MKTSPGSASHGMSRCGGNRSISPIIARRSRNFQPKTSSFRVSRPAPRLQNSWRSARRAAAGRVTPTVPRSIPARQNCFRPTSARDCSDRTRLTRCGDLFWAEHGEGPDGEVGAVAARPEAWGDVVLARKETPTSYHLSVVVDDALQGVTEVVRGQDLFWSTSVHRLLQQLLGLPQPAYRHHRLILDAAGRKLSKSTEATGLRELRAGGATPADIRRLAGLP